MKQKNSIIKGILAITIAIFFIAGCKKKVDDTPAPNPTPYVSPTDSTSQTTRASDQSNVDNESNQAMDEANSALGQVSTTRGMQATCGYTIDSSQKATGKLTLNYDGTLCNGKIRTGSITIQLPWNGTTITTWATAGSTSSLTFTNYKVVYPNNNNASIEFNGKHFVTNTSGGGWLALYLGTPIIHKVRSHQLISFNNATPIEWNSAIQRTVTYDNATGILNASAAADSLYNNEHILMWGTNQMGDHFVITMPIDFSYDIWNPITNCVGKPLTGTIEYHGITFAITVNYGVNVDGTTPFTGTCPYGYKIGWTNNNTGYSYSVVIPYPY